MFSVAEWLKQPVAVVVGWWILVVVSIGVMVWYELHSGRGTHA
ncbi:MAG TPA: hypothetical protein VJ818_03025 [Actinomycetota bacterium]|nr:hypothetical protein [Actinomycetota bacterium]